MESRRRRVAAAMLALPLAACSPMLGPASPDANWNTHDSAHFTLYTRPGSVAEHSATAIGQALDAQYEHVIAFLDLRYSGRISGFLYDSPQDAGGNGEFGRGFLQVESFKVVCVSPLSDSSQYLFRHEANHAILGGALGPAGTRFISEGLATAIVSDGPGYGPRAWYQWTRANAGSLRPLNELVAGKDYSDAAYDTTGSFLAYLLETYGPAPLKTVYYATADDFSRQFGQAYGRSLDQAEADWKKFCGIGG